MRWKSLAFLGKIGNDRKWAYGFSTQICPLSVDDLTSFQQDLYIMINKIEFNFVSNKSQR